MKTKKSFSFGRLIKRFFLGLVAFLVLINLVIIFSGKTYMYKGIKETYLKGKTGPGIYDSLTFPTRTIHTGTPQEWEQEKQLLTLKQDHLDYLNTINSTSFLILKNGKIVAENYFEEHNASRVSNTFSVAKSYIGLLIGIAIDKGYINSFDDPVTKYLTFFPEKDSQVTLRHLLGMASGLNWQESGKNPFSENAAAYYGSDLKKLMRSLDFNQSPQEEFYYASGNSQLLGFILEEATGMKVSEFMEEHLWKKIGAENPAYWSLDDEDGLEKAFCCLYATTRDYARLGQLILNEGKWNGEQIIQSSTLKELTSSSYLKDNEPNKNYGLHFWLVDHPEHKVIYARGILGQFVIVVPELDLVIVRTGHRRGDKYAYDDGNLGELPKGTIPTKDLYKDNHTKDLFEYIRIAKELLN